MANNESLPFKDSTFDCYLANLSLMLVHNHSNQLKEAFRVAQPGATFGFTIWGRKENSNNMTILSRVFAKHGLLPPGGAPAKSFFDLSNDLGALQ